MFGTIQVCPDKRTRYLRLGVSASGQPEEVTLPTTHAVEDFLEGHPEVAGVVFPGAIAIRRDVLLVGGRLLGRLFGACVTA
jgi:hypothetical protein